VQAAGDLRGQSAVAVVVAAVADVANCTQTMKGNRKPCENKQRA